MNINYNSLTFSFQNHINKEVIFCHFPYNPKLLKEFKSEFPSARWSRTHTAWYLSDTALFRKRLKIPLKELQHAHFDQLFSENQNEFRKFRAALEQKMFSQRTIQTYLSEFMQLLVLLKRKPVYLLSTEQLNSYFLYCIKKLNHSENQIYSRMNAIKCYFKLVQNKAEIFDQVIRPKQPHILPKVLSKQEVKRLFDVTENLKHKLMLKIAYGMGLRVSEIAHLKIAHFQLDRCQVLIQCAKGKKDRYVNLPKSLLPDFEDYLKSYQPKQMLFEGQFAENYSIRSIQQVFKTAMAKAQIHTSIGIHGLRHSFATHLLEAGTDMVFIQKLLGHKNVKTTEIYAKISTKTISKVTSPLDEL